MRVSRVLESLNASRNWHNRIILVRVQESNINAMLEPYDQRAIERILTKARELYRNPISIHHIKQAIDMESLSVCSSIGLPIAPARPPMGDYLLLTDNQLDYRCGKRLYTVPREKIDDEALRNITTLFASVGRDFQLFDDAVKMRPLLDFIKQGFRGETADISKYIFRRDPPLMSNSALDVTKTQRRYDALAKLLSVDSNVSACVALTVFEGKLVISANPPRPSSDVTQDIIVEYLSRKLALIGAFLRLPNSRDLYNIAKNTVDELNLPDCGGVSMSVHKFNSVSPSKYTERAHSERVKSSLTTELLKLRADFQSGVVDVKELCDAILNPFVFARGSRYGEHAEQLIIKYVFRSDRERAFEGKIHIGIDKQCCYDCAQVMQEYSKFVAVRGYGCNKFPATIRRDEVVIDPAVAASEEKLDAAHPESDSEPELDEREIKQLRELPQRELRLLRAQGLAKLRALPPVPSIVPRGEVVDLSRTPFPTAPKSRFFSAARPTGAVGALATAVSQLHVSG